MATITLTGNTLNGFLGVGSFTDIGTTLSQAKQTTGNLTKELGSLKIKIDVASSATNLDTSKQQISNAQKREENKKSSLSLAYDKLDKLISNVGTVDNKVAIKVEQLKNDFYSKYSYLKPESEKSGWEKVKDGAKNLWDGICDLGNAISNILGDIVAWCKEHWKLIVTAVLVIVAVVLICTGVGGPFAAIILAVCKGLIIGAITGGLMGGISSVASGGSFLEGFENGAFSGALTGALFGGIGGVGQVLGSSCKVLSFLGSTAKAIPIVSKIFGGISLGMAGFDLLAFGIGLFNPDNFLVKLNQKLHSNQLYNGIQIGANILAVFGGGFTQGMKNPTCFVAGTMILTANGLVAIENIRAGDIVISTNPDTMEKSEKRVVETYIREDTKIIHIVVNGEEIITTETHPFYVNKRGFVEAGRLKVGDELLDVDNNILLVEDYTVEITEEPTTVYNFQVEDFHTYFVGDFGILVHNATCTPENIAKLKEHLDGTGAKDGAKPDGNISGTHNKNNFMSELKQNDGRITLKQPLQDIDGVEIIKYLGIDGHERTKTVYDPSIISTNEFVSRGLSAVKNMPGELYDYPKGLYQFPDNQGVNWDIYIRNGEVITVYPSQN